MAVLNMVTATPRDGSVILGVGKAQPRVSWDGAQPRARFILPLSLSWDHRAVDGAAAGRFNACLARVLTDFRLALL